MSRLAATVVALTIALLAVSAKAQDNPYPAGPTVDRSDCVDGDPCKTWICNQHWQRKERIGAVVGYNINEPSGGADAEITQATFDSIAQQCWPAPKKTGALWLNSTGTATYTTKTGETKTFDCTISGTAYNNDICGNPNLPLCMPDDKNPINRPCQTSAQKAAQEQLNATCNAIPTTQSEGRTLCGVMAESWAFTERQDTVAEVIRQVCEDPIQPQSIKDQCVLGNITENQVIRDYVNNRVPDTPYLPPPDAPTIPNLSQTLTQSYLQTNTFVTEEWAQASADRWINERVTFQFGDPHIIGFDGTAFEFMGEAGKVYSIFSEAKHQFNAHMDSVKGVQTELNDATWMTKFGLKYSDEFTATLELVEGGQTEQKTDSQGIVRMVPAEGAKVLKLVINGQDVSDKLYSGATQEFMANDEDDVRVHFPKQHNVGDAEIDGAVVVIETPEMHFTWSLESEGALHLDSSERMMTVDVSAPHGVLGQTVFWNVPGFKKEIQGEMADYEVSHLLAADSKFNRFGMKVAASRRLLAAEEQLPQQLLTKFAYTAL